MMNQLLVTKLNNMTGKIIKNISNDYTVIGTNNLEYVCKARGLFRNINVTPMVGDNVDFNETEKIITSIHKRKNYLVRPPISNIEQLFIITSVKDPDLDTYLLDKLLVIAEFNSIKPIICFTKVDLLNSNELAELSIYTEYYKRINYEVVINSELELIKNMLADKMSVFTGQSGAGKSTLLNKLDHDLHIKTNDISYALGRGKHTTRHSQLMSINNGLVADTPGFSALEFVDMTASDIRDNFVEFQELRDGCKYKDCMHIKEDHCMVKEEVEKGNIIRSRYNNYLKFIDSKR